MTIPPTIPIEVLAQVPFPGMAFPGSLAFSPDDKLITYLHSPDGTLSRQLYALDIETAETTLLVIPPGGGATEENLSLEEKLQRERQRQRETGITGYTWGKNGRLLIPLHGSIYVQDGPGAPLRQIVTNNGKPALSPRFSPDANWVAYVQDAELYVVSADGGQPRQLTSGARGTGKTHGLAEFVAQEEMGRHQGFWWSPDSYWLAFEEVDETHIPVYRIVHQGSEQPGEVGHEDHRYPFAGQENAKVRLGVVSREGGEPVWMDLGAAEYLTRVNWLPNGRLTTQRQNREQTVLDLDEYDPQTGQRHSLLTETNETWINLHHLFRPLKDGRFIWASERTGYQHLYLHSPDGSIQALTSGEWMVEEITAVDEKNRLLYFTATRATPLESHLYVVSLNGGAVRQITTEPGFHNVVIDNSYGRFLDTCQSVNQPPTITLRSLADGNPICPIFTPSDPRIAQLNLQPPELVTLPSRDGETLYGAIYPPPANFGPGPYPTVVAVYGGPHAQVVANAWRMTVNMRAQYLASLGFLVFSLDNRGSARRGLAFEGHIQHNMGDLEVQDQVDGVNWLIEQGLAMKGRVGIYGWSYGGYMACMCLARAPETFQVAIAGAPVTAWDGYDTHYTERYMGTPQTNPNGYETGSVMSHVSRITGKLLLIHGLLDENVHFRHTARLINALIAHRKRYDLLLLPDARHSTRKTADVIYMEEVIRDYFLENL